MKRSRARSKEAIEFARSQRECSNEFAQAIWQGLRNRKCCGQKFRREYPIPPYTVDFCCVELQLVVEIDGESHFTDSGIERDRERDLYLRRLGYQVLRIPGYEVIRNGDAVLSQIQDFVRAAMDKQNPSPPTPKTLNP